MLGINLIEKIAKSQRKEEGILKQNIVEVESG